MSDIDKAPQALQFSFKVLGQYVRDLSFKNEVATRGLSVTEVQPDTQVEIGVDANKRAADKQYEVITRFKVVSKNRINGEVLFVIELDYGGAFLVEGVPEEQLHPFLLIECPRILFPFARRIIMNLTGDAGLPTLNIDSVDFVQMYRDESQRRAEVPLSPI